METTQEKQAIEELKRITGINQRPIERAQLEGIENPNSSGQGYHPKHINTPFSQILLDFPGIEYSHSYLVTYFGTSEVRHCFKFSVDHDWSISVGIENKYRQWNWVCSKSSSSCWAKSSIHREELLPYLRYKSRQLKKEHTNKTKGN